MNSDILTAFSNINPDMDIRLFVDTYKVGKNSRKNYEVIPFGT